MYRRGNAYHGAHPFFMWYWGQRGREKTSRVIVVGADNATVPAIMGWETRRLDRRGDRDGARHDGAQRADHDAAPPAVHDLRRDVMATATAAATGNGNGQRNASRAAATSSRPSSRGASTRPRRRGRMPSAASRCRRCASRSPASRGSTSREILAGKNILLIGTTGFVGKVALSMLLHRYPDVGKVFCLVRPGAGNTADERFYKKVATSEAFDPLRERARRRLRGVHALEDRRDPRRHRAAAVQLHRRAVRRARGGRAASTSIINSAGLVSFAPSLESALRINAMGAKNVLDVARKAGARLVHVSTCYVAGQRDGDVWEDEPVVGYFPRSSAISHDYGSDDELLDRDFDPIAEIADCQKIIDQARERSNDRAAHLGVPRARRRGARASSAAIPTTRTISRSRSPASARSG